MQKVELLKSKLLGKEDLAGRGRHRVSLIETAIARQAGATN